MGTMPHLGPDPGRFVGLRLPRTPKFRHIAPPDSPSIKNNGDRHLTATAATGHALYLGPQPLIFFPRALTSPSVRS